MYINIQLYLTDINQFYYIKYIPAKINFLYGTRIKHKALVWTSRMMNKTNTNHRNTKIISIFFIILFHINFKLF